ncbi:MAG: 3'-5' exonuclease [Muribaculaceae bacterium]|nr:3'-5' exonuclease [Muribaculaceae bacterium]
MDNFVAIDVETANYEKSSICAIAAVKVRNGVIVDKRYSLINPEPNYYAYRCVQVHGLTDADTWNAPAFGTVWAEWQDWLEDLPLAAHNARFDSGCVEAACRIYGIDPPEQPWMCTCVAARKQIPRGILPSKSLDSLCNFFGISLNHHNALSDAEACAKLGIMLL